MSAREVLREASGRIVLLYRQGDKLAVCGPLEIVWDMYPRLAEVEAEILAMLDEAANGHTFVTLFTFDVDERYFQVCIWCGVPWSMHGRPEPGNCRLVYFTDRDAPPLVAARSAVAAVLDPICARCHRLALVLPSGICPACLDETA